MAATIKGFYSNCLWLIANWNAIGTKMPSKIKLKS